MVQVECYGEIKKFESRKEALAFFLECVAYSEGSERERYMYVYLQLLAGKDFCTDMDTEVL